MVKVHQSFKAAGTMVIDFTKPWNFPEFQFITRRLQSAGDSKIYGTRNLVEAILKQSFRDLNQMSSSDSVEKAVRLFSEMTDYKIVRLTAEYLPGATDVLRQSFFPDEKFCSCVRVLQDSEEIHTDSKYKVTKATKELEDLGLDAAKDGVSFCAVDVKTGEVLGVALNKIQTKPKPGGACYLEQYAKEHVRDPSAQAFVDVMLDVDSRYNLFGDDGDCYFEILYLSVKSVYKGKGIGTALVSASAKLAQDMRLKNTNKNPSIDVKSEAKEYKDSKALTMSPKCVSAIFTSRFSQRCGRRAGYEEILVVPYSELTYNGKKFSDVAGPDHPHCTLSVKSLS